MRVAPAGLSFPPGQAFQHGVSFAAITHGHASGYLPAGVLADLIACLLEGASLHEALERSVAELRHWPGHEETLACVEQAIELSDSSVPHAEAIQRLGGGWVGEEALAIALYCALSCSQDWETAVLTAVNHSGDSDSTGCITGAILGALHGAGALPQSWIAQLESAAGIRAVADDLYRVVREGTEPLSQYDEA